MSGGYGPPFSGSLDEIRDLVTRRRPPDERADSGTFITSSTVARYMTVDGERFRHPSWLSAVGVGVGYLLIMAVLTVLLFGLPYALFVSL